MTKQTDALIEALIKEATRIEEDCLYSSKSHYNASVTWGRRHLLLGIPATIFGAAASLLIKSCPELATVFAGAATTLTALVTFLKSNERAAVHKAAGAQYHALRNDARIFREIEAIEAEDTTMLSGKLKDLAKRRNGLNQSSPSIPERAFQKAREGIEAGEVAYEIDKAGGD